MAAGKTTITLTKRCECHGTSSGPRIVLVDGLRPREVIFRFVRFACDICNKSWQME